MLAYAYEYFACLYGHVLLVAALLGLGIQMAQNVRDSDEFPAGYGDFALVSSDGVRFYIQRLFLFYVSPVFKDMFGTGEDPSELVLTEDADTLDRLLRFIDPIKDPLPVDSKSIVRLLEAATKYRVSKALRWWENEVLREGSKMEQPIIAFSLATRYNLPNAARKALQLLVTADDSIFTNDHQLDPRLIAYLTRLRTERSHWLRDGLWTLYVAAGKSYTKWDRTEVTATVKWAMDAAGALHRHPCWRIRSLTMNVFNETPWNWKRHCQNYQNGGT